MNGKFLFGPVHEKLVNEFMQKVKFYDIDNSHENTIYNFNVFPFPEQRLISLAPITNFSNHANRCAP